MYNVNVLVSALRRCICPIGFPVVLIGGKLTMEEIDDRFPPPQKDAFGR